MLLANYEDFENGGLYSNYRRYPFFAARAEYLTGKFNGSFLIVGCGWGFLVDELRQRGVDAWGCDLSDYALRSAGREVPNSFPYIKKADGTNVNDLKLVGPGRFDVAVSEDVLTCLDNPGQMQKMHRAMFAVASNVVHIVSSGDDVDRGDPRVRWHPESWWNGQFRNALVVASSDPVFYE